MMDKLKVEFLEPVMCKGRPRSEDLARLDELATSIAARHEGLAPRGATDLVVCRTDVAREAAAR